MYYQPTPDVILCTHIITITGNLKPQTMQVLEDCLYLENIQEYVHAEDKIVSYSVVLFT